MSNEGAGVRQFYGGDPLLGNPSPSAGEISAGHYTGPEAHAQGPWKCPACGAENQGPIPQGCMSCHAGQPGRHVGQPSGVLLDPPPEEEIELMDPAFAAAAAWCEQHPDVTPIEAFAAGFRAARAQLLAHTMQAAPVTVDVETLAPAGKARRTIIAALEIFADQILSQAPDEIASGEWCSPSEVAVLIAQLKGAAE